MLGILSWVYRCSWTQLRFLEASIHKLSEYLAQFEIEIAKLRRRLWQLQGKDIFMVQEYRYLGIDLNTGLTAGVFTLKLQIQRYRPSMLVAQETDNGSSQCWYWTGLPGFILIGRFLEAVMGIHMFIVENLCHLSFDSSDATTTSQRPEGYVKPFE
ncbi:hypothetical protein GAYE_SCF68G6908 [Galdieria yellowstonensis]|uniref:Uncharacterized protein n=1 Tax=Galdieria yellowstonensis TaxID=3028027 RepID=A0AAV9IP01_9RHOD|nr:hypothetical protein GAYE_SCF68G6908 [Galdieria yellowstonensis]